MNLKALIGTIIGLILIGGSGFAIWTAFMSGTSKVVVTSGSPIKFTSSLDVNNVDATNESVQVNDSIIVENKNGDSNIKIDFAILRQDDITDTCGDYADDVQVIVSANNGWDTIQSGDVKFLPKGATKRMNVTYNIVQWACPQNVTVNMNLTGTKA